MMEGMEDWMEAEDHPHRPSNHPFPLSDDYQEFRIDGST